MNSKQTYTNTRPYHPEYVAEGITEGLAAGFEGAAKTIIDPNTPQEVRDQVREQVVQFAEANSTMPSAEILEKVTLRETMIKGLSKEDPEINVLIITPKGGDKVKSCLYEIHGGGWTMGDTRVGKNALIKAAVDNDCIVVTPDYYLAPEFRHQKMIDSLEAVVNWMKESKDELGIDLNRLVVRGSSAGAHLAAAISHRLKLRDNGFQFCAQVLHFPMLDDRAIHTSNFESSDACWPLDASVRAWKAFLGEDYGTPYVPEDAAPARAKSFEGIPATFMDIAEHDHDRDTCIEYAKNLMQTGIFVDLHVHGGNYHAAPFYQLSGKAIRHEMLHHLSQALTGKFARR